MLEGCLITNVTQETTSRPPLNSQHGVTAEDNAIIMMNNNNKHFGEARISPS
jgi:hypothetical protein